jgi:hypothetical protein
MTKASIIFEETKTLTAKYSRFNSGEYLEYISTIRIKSSGKFPVEMTLQFDGIPPFAAPMPPEEKTIRAQSILDLCIKVTRWLKKYGYELK